MARKTAGKTSGGSVPLEKETYNLTYSIAFWGLAALITISPFLRGLYFNTEQYKALFFAAIIFFITWLWNMQKGRPGLFQNPMDYVFISLPLVYIVSSFNAVNTGLAVDEIIKNTLYFAVYWIVARLVINVQDARKLLAAVYAAAAGVSLLGLLTATELIYIRDGFQGGRIHSSFQYPNALASLLTAALFVGLYLWFMESSARADSKEKMPGFLERQQYGLLMPYLYTLLNYLICTVLVGARSNGGFIVLAVFLVLYFIGVKGPDKLKMFAQLASTLLPGAGAALLFVQNAAAGNYAAAWLWVLAGAVAALGLQYLNDRLGQTGSWDKLWAKKKILLIILILLVLAGGAAVWLFVTQNQELVNKVMAELRLRNASERIYFYSDALKMAQERPLLGWGGGGWQEAYSAYQGYLYYAKQAHSYYLQVLVETGVLGLAVVLAMWSVFLYLGHRLYHKLAGESADKFLIWTVFTAALAIGAHALIDFDLSLSALTMVLCLLWGIVSALYNQYNSLNQAQLSVPAGPAAKRKIKKEHNKHISTALVAVACAAVLIATGSFTYAANYKHWADKKLKQGDVKSGILMLESAANKNPFSSVYNANLAGIYDRLGKGELAMKHAQQALDKASFTPDNYALVAMQHLKSGRYSEAASYAEKALAHAPYEIYWYEFLIQTYSSSGYNLLAGGKDSEASANLEKAAGVEGMINKKVAALGSEEKRLWNVAPMLAPSPVINLYTGASLCLLGDYTGAGEKLNMATSEQKTREEALIWLSIAAEKTGDTVKAGQYRNEALKINPDVDKKIDQIRNLFK